MDKHTVIMTHYSCLFLHVYEENKKTNVVDIHCGFNRTLHYFISVKNWSKLKSSGL